jgi:hypothetical protein
MTSAFPATLLSFARLSFPAYVAELSQFKALPAKLVVRRMIAYELAGARLDKRTVTRRTAFSLVVLFHASAFQIVCPLLRKPLPVPCDALQKRAAANSLSAHCMACMMSPNSPA